ncbi:probable protein phosphatase 2C BIPP2C1 isoform X2 [Carica papaya]|uniref:probable protein phosphatase 2C BIPP2C1 isoform X2 n=1 Tax=Carica papaya TaxID=3649 RepID=UPI000B8CE214|nr:probable protein phosphatase 2C BIPP2C1 isoform X2 [Carica papaya]
MYCSLYLNREDVSAKGFFLSSGAASLPQLSKVLAGGEDAYFVICQNWLGVADGASSWSLEETRDGLYAHELLRNCQKIVSESKSLLVTNPVEIICRSAAESQSHGLSTILVAYFDNQVLHVANIGDSGFILLRNGTVFQISSPMFHDFNLPVQIKRDDDPSEFLEVYHVHLDEGDVLITATDGLFDNLYEQEIASIVSKSLQENMQPQEIAELLARKAQVVGSSASARSPFADAAQAAGYTGYRGGKLDDVTVIVSLVQKKSV